MTYPKPIMSKQELMKMGFTDRWLMMLYRTRNTGLAWKAGRAKNSRIYFDTEKLEKLRVQECVATD